MTLPVVAACEEDVDERTAKPCSLITEAELVSVVGVAAVSVRSDYNRSGGRYCEWIAAAEVADDLFPKEETFRMYAWYGLRYYAPDLGGDEFTPVSGIGDAASRGEALNGDLMFHKGPHVFRLSHFKTDNERRQLAIATIILGRL